MKGNAVMDERTRHELHQRFDELLGVDLAVALMSSLPPTGWGDVATKHDLEELERRLDLRFEARLERGLREQTRTMVFAMLGANATFGALAFAAARLA
jgi:hypothetical protein